MDTRSNATFFIKCIGVFSRPDFPRARFCPVLKPLRHRVVSTRVYIYSIVVVWAVGIFIFGLMGLSFYYLKLARETVHVVVHFCLFISFVMICASYLKIRTRLSSTAPKVAVVNRRQTAEYNVRLSRTLFVVTCFATNQVVSGCKKLL